MSENPAPKRAGRGLFIGRYLGIEFYLDYSWFLIAAIVVFQLEAFFSDPLRTPFSEPASVVMAIGAAVLFFLSILLHELGHSVVSQRCGIPVPRITLLFIGGLAEISREPDEPKSELKIALGGPLVTVILVVLYSAVVWLANGLGWEACAAVFYWLAATNVFLVIFNMIPGYPLDGGRVLRALLWMRWGNLRRATYITSRIGIAFSWLLIAVGVVLVLNRQWNAVVFFLIAIFLKSAAESGYANAQQREALAGVRVREIMTPAPVCIPASLRLNLAVDDFFLAHHHVAYPVCGEDGEFRGLLRLEFVRGIPREKWPYTTAGDVVAEAGGNLLKIGADAPASRAMRLLLAPGQGRLAVVEGERLVGIVTRHDILHVIEIRNELEG